MEVKGDFIVKEGGKVVKKKKQKPKESGEGGIALTFLDVETLIVLLQQVKVTVGVYPFENLNQVGDTINKLREIYDLLKGKESLKT